MSAMEAYDEETLHLQEVVEQSRSRDKELAEMLGLLIEQRADMHELERHEPSSSSSWKPHWGDSELALSAWKILDDADVEERMRDAFASFMREPALHDATLPNEVRALAALRLATEQALEHECNRYRFDMSSLPGGTISAKSAAAGAEAAHERAPASSQEADAAAEAAAELQRALDESRAELSSTRAALANALERVQALSRDLHEVREDVQALTSSFGHEVSTVFSTVEQRCAVMQREYDRAVSEYATIDRERKKLHNQVIELKGNIRVMCRVRPLLEREERRHRHLEREVARVPYDTHLVMWSGDKGEVPFDFDHVFSPETQQESVFAEVEPLATSVLDGYNACIFAYGQTGSGKTYTMLGEGQDGIVYQALRHLFAESMRRRDVDTRFALSCMEIYNEAPRDLLDGNASVNAGSKLTIQHKNGAVSVPELSIVELEDENEFRSYLAAAGRNRAKGATDMNEHSSRSHMVVTVYVEVRNPAKGAFTRSKLHLIDLAGSERVKRSHSEGERMREAIAINSSLSSLVDVVSALHKKSKHIPYRNSKLTHFLEDSLGGAAKTLMIVQISPCVDDFNESINSLKFAERASKTELGRARKNVTDMKAAKSEPHRLGRVN